jgi:hypothetical protein
LEKRILKDRWLISLILATQDQEDCSLRLALAKSETLSQKYPIHIEKD